MKFLAFALTLGLSFACGKIDKTEITSTPIPGSENAKESSYSGPALVIDDVGSRPACTANVEGVLLYIRALGRFETCVSGAWTPISIGGGAQGISSSVDCKMTVSQASLIAAGLDSAPASGINFAYGVTNFGDGSKYVQIRVSSGESSLSSGVFWDKSQQEYLTSESDSVVFDVHGIKDFGFWYVSENAELTGDANNPFSIVYVDPTLTDGKMMTFDTATNCRIASRSN